MKPHVIVMISGKQGSGKSTLSKELLSRITGYDQIPYQTRFAKVLYEMHDAALEVAKRYGIPCLDKEGAMLQWLGTEWGRNTKGQNVWVDALVNDVQRRIDVAESSAAMEGANQLFVVIDDMRFENEFHAFDKMADNPLGKKPSVLVIRVRLEAGKEDRKARTHSWRENDTHASETGLDEYADGAKFDVTFNTDNGLHSPADIGNWIMAKIAYETEP